VRDVSIIGLNLVYPAFSKASFIVNQLFFIIFIYSISIIEFQTTIQARAIIHIIEVAEKYSFFIRYKKLKPGHTPKKPSKNVSIIIQPILKLLNCATIKKYIANIAIIIANHKSLKVSIVSFHSHHQFI